MSVEPTLSIANQIFNEDCLQGLKRIPNESVHLAFADPPFNIGYEYDIYEDRKEDQQYIQWCHEWMSELYRVLREDGTFWLAIGDEYAAELKLAAQDVGFLGRSWVIWYYTFGVHCKLKFTRSHAHLFYFTKHPKNFTFNKDEIAVPSARQLIYGDKRANPTGRSPDDTWILRPQDARESFQPSEDIWYFPRVNGTFKERAGFHGCQMPEQLLGRIIRACSNEGDLVLDPFAGSATTLVVAKKLGREFLGFELSEDYAERGTQRLERTLVGDKLEGVEDPKSSVRSQEEAAQKLKKSEKGSSNRDRKPPTAVRGPLQTGFRTKLTLTEPESQELDELIEAYHKVTNGRPAEHIVCDPDLAMAFQKRCDQKKISLTSYERNRLLFALRSRGLIDSKAPPQKAKSNKKSEWNQLRFTFKTNSTDEWYFLDSFLYATEIAWQRNLLSDAVVSLEELLCQPTLAESYSNFASQLTQGVSVLELRLSTLTLRDELLIESDRLKRSTSTKLSKKQQTLLNGLALGKFPKEANSCQISSKSLNALPSKSGIYRLKDASGRTIFHGSTLNLSRRCANQFTAEAWKALKPIAGPLKSLQFEWCELEIDRLRPLQFHVALLQSPSLLNLKLD